MNYKLNDNNVIKSLIELKVSTKRGQKCIELFFV